MQIGEMAEALGWKLLTETTDTTRAVKGCYCGDLLSWVMGRAKADDAWLTVMGNVNAIAVAVLADVACILLTEASPLDEAAGEKARAQDVAVLRSPRPAYELALDIGRLLEKEGTP